MYIHVLVALLLIGFMPLTGWLTPVRTFAQFDQEGDLSSHVTPDVRRAAEESVDRALAWMATQQLPDGSFRSIDMGQPGVTSLCLLSFLANGHTPGVGPYGEQIINGLEFVQSTQKPNGALIVVPPGQEFGAMKSNVTASYNHAIGGLVLCEAFGSADADRSARLGRVVERAIQLTLLQQRSRRRNRDHAGGWRYFDDHAYSDLSVTSWQVMFLRSAKDAGFDVPAAAIEAATRFVRNCYDPQTRTFMYSFYRGGRHKTPAMAGAGIVSLAQAGKHDTKIARGAGDFILRQEFTPYNPPRLDDDDQNRYHYGVFYSTFGMFHLGEKYWEQFYPKIVRVLTDAQSRGGSWEPERRFHDRDLGKVYTTALITLALSIENQLLPIFQK